MALVAAEDSETSSLDRSRALLGLGAASQLPTRPMADLANSRPLLPTSYNTMIRRAGPAPSSQSTGPRTEAQVMLLVRESMKAALDENKSKAEEASGVSNDLKPGVTIDLSHKQIQTFPDEVVDVIKHELERYCPKCLMPIQLINMS